MLTIVDKNLKNNLQFMTLTNLWPWNKAKVIKPCMHWQTQSKVIIMQSLKDLNSVRQKGGIHSLVESENTSIISFEYVQKWKIVFYLTYLTILHKSQLN